MKDRTLSTRTLWITGVLSLAAVIIFLLWPDLDLVAARMLYNGQDFVLANSDVWVFYARFLRPGLPYILGALGLYALWMAWQRPTRRGLYLRRVIFVALVMLLGPALVVNGLLKSNSGRPRPKQVVEFAGQETYRTPFDFGGPCERNCSFVSGDASVAFAVIAFAFLAARRRVLWIGLAIGFGAAIGALRMAVGGHFLSDVVFAGLITVAIAALCYRYLLERWEPPDPGPS